MEAVIVIAFRSTGAVMHTQGRMARVSGKTGSISHRGLFQSTVLTQLPCFLSAGEPATGLDPERG